MKKNELPSYTKKQLNKRLKLPLEAMRILLGMTMDEFDTIVPSYKSIKYQSSLPTLNAYFRLMEFLDNQVTMDELMGLQEFSQRTIRIINRKRTWWVMEGKELYEEK